VLPADSILRKLPATANLEQRIRLEALVFVADTISHAFRGLREITTRLGPKITNLTFQDRAALFSHAWTIIDQVHAARLLLRSHLRGKFGPNQKAFFDKYAAVHTLRNKMDHLNQNIANAAKQKGIAWPLFGVLSYFFVESHQCVQTEVGLSIKGGTIITITSGIPIQRPNTALVLANPAGRAIQVPVSLFTFGAFGMTFDIDGAAIDFAAVLNFASQNIDRKLREQVAKTAKETGIAVDTLMAPALANLVFEMDFIFDE